MEDMQLLDDIRNSPLFELPLAKNVYWVSFNSLGKAELSYEKIISLIAKEPEVKQQYINTIPDAISLFVLSDFKKADDNIYIEENGITWEHCKPGKIAVLSNEGCCASCAAWANYLLSSKFEKSGYLSVIRPRNGHVINFFVREGWYYFLDLQNFVQPYRQDICCQTGKRTDFVKTKFLTSVMVKAKSLEAYIKYYEKYVSRVVPEHLFVVHNMNTLLSVGIKKVYDDRKCIYLQKDKNIFVVENSVKHEFIDYEIGEKCKPLNYPKW